MHLVAERHKSELRQRLSHLLALLRLDDEHEEAAAASAAELAAFSPRLDGARIVAVDLCGRNLGGETALQIPAAVKSFAQFLKVDMRTGAERPHLVGLVAHASQHVEVSRRIALLLGE